MLELTAAISVNDVHHGTVIGTHSHFHLFCSKLATSSYRCSVVSLFYDGISKQEKLLCLLISRPCGSSVVMRGTVIKTDAESSYRPMLPSCYFPNLPFQNPPFSSRSPIHTHLVAASCCLPPPTISQQMGHFLLRGSSLRHTLSSYCVFPLPAENVSVAIILVLVEGALSTKINDNPSWILDPTPPSS